MDVGPRLTILPINDVPARYTRHNKRQHQEDTIRGSQPPNSNISSTVTTSSKHKHRIAQKKPRRATGSSGRNQQDPTWQEIYNILANNNMVEPQNNQTVAETETETETEDDETKTSSTLRS